MSALVDFLVGLLGALPGAAAEFDEHERARLLAALDGATRGLTAIGPNAPAVHAAAERRRRELAGGDDGA